MGLKLSPWLVRNICCWWQFSSWNTIPLSFLDIMSLSFSFSLFTLIFNYFSHVSLHCIAFKSVFTRYSLSVQSHLLPSLSLVSPLTSYKPLIHFFLAQSSLQSSRHDYIQIPTWHLPSDICHLKLNTYKMKLIFFAKSGSKPLLLTLREAQPFNQTWNPDICQTFLSLPFSLTYIQD